MAYARSITGVKHKFHVGSKYTRCGKRLRFMLIGMRGGRPCKKCWS